MTKKLGNYYFTVGQRGYVDPKVNPNAPEFTILRFTKTTVTIKWDNSINEASYFIKEVHSWIPIKNYKVTRKY